MARPKGQPKLGGRVKGTPNKSTRDVREAIAAFASANVDKMGEWLDAIEDPSKKMDLYLRAIEYHIPKLARSEVSGPGGGPVEVVVKLEQRVDKD